ncbi:DEAD/DEAH box helicase family protein [Oscillibacter valericigenes]|uniref:DEAD/DEAH box helicase family protein n=1 Tax=Oscillibacter valericigenes TaxID=351091 RepID=UPI001F3A7260|nr:DEAD/DEAH box helicase family protein [Oscillibacter valericigenes]MCF2618166.1 DEAD/DEAH box helicase family protein [Oscillibacter valericigenes]
MTNFDFLTSDPQFNTFSTVAVSAERILHIDPAACVLNCRRAMEFAVKWMYSVDGSLVLPYDDRLVSLMDNEDFRDIVGQDIWRRMKLIRTLGNNAAHTGKKISEEQAALCLENLFVFLDFVAYCYGTEYTERTFDPALLKDEPAAPPPVDTEAEVKLEQLMAENAALREELTARRAEQQQTYVPKPLDLSEYKTRKIYIDAMLLDAGWTEGRDWLNEVELPGMPNKSEVGYADYVLYDDTHKPLAVIEAKRTCVDVSKGRQQAKLYADILERKYSRRPVIFLTNGFETRIDDGAYPERKVATIYSKRDLEKLFNLRTMRTSLKNVMVDKRIAGRYYQESAIKAVCDSFDRRNRRKALLVMATGSGKTRTVIALCDVLLNHGWVKNILFLADRNSLVTQAKRSFVNLLPDLSVTNLCEEKDNYTAHCVFSTYQTMMNCIDAVKDEQGKLFTCGHFDLVICDEAHRSIYNKYRDIFNYFDAPLVGLTATPKDEIDKNTYEIFELESGVPTYGYELSQAVKDGFLVDFMSVETKLKFIEQGITYDELSDEDKAAYEDTFEDENGELPERISSSALNEWVFNEDTIKEVLHILMTNGLRIDYGEKLGKTIIFAKNHTHAEKIFEIFNREYPHLPGYAKVIDNYMTYAQSAIDEFSDPKKLPQIAISVDMLDTGIDVPEVLNLVFFKKVMSKAKFWQMIGRGTRLCPGLIDGEDKNKFYIFDFCGNFEFFRMNKGRPTANQMALQGAIFNLKAQMAYKLQDLQFQTDDLIAFRKELVADMVRKVRELNKENFAVRQHLKYVELYANPDNYAALSYEDTLIIKEELAPLIMPDEDEPAAMRFDALMYGIELAYLVGKKYTKARSDLFKKVSGIAGVANIPEIMAQAELIRKILHTDFLDNAGINEFENIRESLRGLVKYIQGGHPTYTTNFDDEILSMDWHESELENDDLKNYKAKAEFYVRQHQDEAVIAKLKSNVPLNSDDVAALEKILWSEVGTKEDYEAEIGSKPLGEFVREIVGLDMKAAKEAFSMYLNDTSLDSRQIYFVNQIVEYIVHNGLMKDLSVLQESPFTDRGSVVDIFTDLTVWMGIRKIIEQVNANAVA